MTSHVLFRAAIAPHRSLSARGLAWLLAGIAAAAGLIALRFWMLGAWPVLLFAGLEIGLAAILLAAHHRSGRDRELIELHPDEVRIVRTIGGRRRERALSAAWLRVALNEEPGRVPRLWVRNRVDREEIAKALGEDPKRDLARALSAAVAALREPRFDNPQLRDTA